MAQWLATWWFGYWPNKMARTSSARRKSIVFSGTLNYSRVHDSNAMAAISAGLHVPVVIWGQVDQFTPYHFDRFVPATPAYVEMTINTWSATAGTKTATINKQGSLPFTIWDKQPTFQDVAIDEVSDFFAGNQRP